MLFNMLIDIWYLLNFVATAFGLYQLAVALAAFPQKKQEEPAPVTYHRFAAIIAARNEENVMDSLIGSIRLQNYPAELIDVVVVADNCTDNTAQVAQRAGAVVYKRFNHAEIGKGYAVKFALEKIWEERDVYDAYCVLDADNVCDRDFFYHMNRALCQGAKVAQGYRDIKNPTDSWIAGCHSLFFWMENRFFNSARSFLGLSATINGTAFMMKADYVRKHGYNVKTITEDIEFSMQTIMNGESIAWVPEAKVYDEQPLSVQQSMSQRTRWTNGLIQCMIYYLKPLAKSFFKKPSWVKFDGLMFISSLPVVLVGVLSSLMCLILATFRVLDFASSYINIGILAGGSLAALWLVGLLSVLLEGKGVRKMRTAILTYPVFNVMWILIYAKCIFKRDTNWKPIVHARNISISEIESSRSK